MNTGLQASGVALWRGDRCLCRDLDFNVLPGQALQLAGPNGSGKTTLLRVLTGLGRLDEGDILWDGSPIGKSADYHAQITYLGHRNGLKLQLSPKENLYFYQSITRYSSDITVETALVTAGLGKVMDRACGSLSMGEQRRTSLARLLLARSRLWLLDEPLTSVDVEGVAWVGRLLQSHLQNGGAAVYATHQSLPMEPSRLHVVDMGGSGG